MRPVDAATAAVARRAQFRKLMGQWTETQKPRIVAARGKIVAAACAWEAEKIASARGFNDEPVSLTVKQVQLCEDRACSSIRLEMFGAQPLRRGTTASEQTEWIRALLKAGGDPYDAPCPWVRLGAAQAGKRAHDRRAA